MLDAARFRAGEMEELRSAARELAPRVWELVRRGFVTEEDGLPLHVHGAPRDAAERICVRAIAKVLEPARRARIEDGDALVSGAIAEAQLLAAEEHGAAVTITDRSAVVDDSVELDRGERAIVDAAVAALDERTRRVVTMRFAEAKSEADTAQSLACGCAAIRSRERRARHRVKRALRAIDGARFGDAAVDALLAGREAPAITFERIERDVLRRTFQEEPRPYAIRARWGIGAAAIAAAAWLLMLATR